MEKQVHASSEAKNTLEMHLGAIEKSLQIDSAKPKTMFEGAAFRFENVGVAHRIMFDPMLTQIDDKFVYGNPVRDEHGKIMFGPNGEMRSAVTGEILYSKFTNKDGSKRILRPVKRYIFFGWHINNTEEKTNPLRFVVSSENADQIVGAIRKTNVFDITKKADLKYSIRPIWDVEEDPEVATDEEIATYEASQKAF